MKTCKLGDIVMDTTTRINETYTVIEVDEGLRVTGSPLVICERRNRGTQKGRVMTAFPMSDLDEGRIIVVKRMK